MTTDTFVLYDAAYVLGALSPADRREFEDHLRVCAVCTRSVGELAGLPGLMSRVPIDQLTAEAEPVPETLLPSLARAVRRERSRRRLAVGAAATAACLITVGAVATTVSRQPSSPASPGATASASAQSGTANRALTAVAPSPVTASARLVTMAWGTRIDLTCAYRSKGFYPASQTPYALFVIDRAGVAEQVATWKALPDRELTVMGASSRARREIAAVEIRTLNGLTILRLLT